MPIALNHPALNKDVQLLCTAAQVCKGWNDAVQGCTASNLAVVVNPEDLELNLSSFACWLRKHARFVSSITAGVVDNGPPVWDEQLWSSWYNYLATAEILLQRALQLAPPPLDETAAAQHAATLSQQDDPRQQKLQLRSFTTGLSGANVLAALPAHSLTRLELQFGSSETLDGPAMSAALARLSSLQQLIIHCPYWCCKMAGSCLPGLAELSNLTSLELCGCWPGVKEPLNAALTAPGLQQLQQLRLLRLHEPCPTLTQLTQLTELSIDIDTYPFDEVQLPTQLQRLHIQPVTEMAVYTKLLQLQKLQHLCMEVCSKRCQPLLQLDQLPAQQHMELLYQNTRPAAATAPVWPQLRHLKLLEISIASEDTSSKRQFVAMVQALSGCKHLTKLTFEPLLDFNGSEVAEFQFTFEDEEGEDEEGEDNEEEEQQQQQQQQQPQDGIDDVVDEVDVQALDVFACIAALTDLQDLCIGKSGFTAEGSPPMPGSALALTALVGLTRLVLQECGEAVGDQAAAAIASSCALLQHLNLRGCNLFKMDCEDEFEQLQQLTELCLEGNPGPLRLLSHWGMWDDESSSDY
jgi:hypothetical protein